MDTVSEVKIKVYPQIMTEGQCFLVPGDESSTTSESFTQELFLRALNTRTVYEAESFITEYSQFRFVCTTADVVAHEEYLDEFLFRVYTLKKTGAIFMHYLENKSLVSEFAATPCMENVFGKELWQLSLEACESGNEQRMAQAGKTIDSAFVSLGNRLHAWFTSPHPCDYLIDAMWLYAYMTIMRGTEYRLCADNGCGMVFVPKNSAETRCEKHK